MMMSEGFWDVYDASGNVETLTPENMRTEYAWYAMNGQCLAVAVALAHHHATTMIAVKWEEQDEETNLHHVYAVTDDVLWDYEGAHPFMPGITLFKIEVASDIENSWLATQNYALAEYAVETKLSNHCDKL